MAGSRMLREAICERGGFTSLEATVALAVSAGVIGVALTAFSTWSQHVTDAEMRLLAGKTAESLIARIGLDLRPAALRLEGRQSGFVWEFAVNPLSASSASFPRLQARYSARREGTTTPFMVIEVPVASALAR